MYSTMLLSGPTQSPTRISFDGVYEDLMAIEKQVLRCIRHQEDWDFISFREALREWSDLIQNTTASL